MMGQVRCYFLGHSEVYLEKTETLPGVHRDTLIKVNGRKLVSLYMESHLFFICVWCGRLETVKSKEVLDMVVENAYT